jgi:hypothetical protein
LIDKYTGLQRMGNREPNRRDLSGQRRHFQGIVDAIISSIVHIVMYCFGIVSSIFCYCFIAISIVFVIVAFFNNIVANIFLLLKILLHCCEYCCTVNCYIIMIIVAFIMHCYELLLHCY